MIKKYVDFINESKESIKSICKKYGITNYTINDDGTVDVDDDVDLRKKNLKKLPLNFGRVTGDFNCSDNQLTTLEGAPKEVESSFDCSYNELETLEGSPDKVNVIFRCSNNKLTTLQGSPRIVRNFFCDNNKLTSLEGGPRVVIGIYVATHNKIINFSGFPDEFNGRINLRNNPVHKIIKKFPSDMINKAIYWINEYDVIDDDGNVSELLLDEVFNELNLTEESVESVCKKYGITNYTINKSGRVDVKGDVILSGKGLRNLPLNFGEVNGNFECNNNLLTSLEGSPIVVDGNFDCSQNQIESLGHGPEIVEGGFNCSNNRLTTLRFGPERVKGFYDCRNNQIVNFDGFPSELDDLVDFSGNPVFQTLRRFPKNYWTDAIWSINAIDAIIGHGVVIEDRIREVFSELDLEYVE